MGQPMSYVPYTNHIAMRHSFAILQQLFIR